MKSVVDRILLALLLVAPAVAYAQQDLKPAEIPIESFAQLPAMISPELSPDGTHIAYIRPIQGRRHLIIQTLAGTEKPTVVPPIEDVEIDWLEWANSDRVVFVVSANRRRGITETPETRLWAINRDGSNPRHIILPALGDVLGSRVGRDLAPAQLQHQVVHWLPDEPNHILVSLDADHNGGNEVRRVDIRDGEYEVVQKDTVGIQHWLTDQTGKVRFGWGYRNAVFRALAIQFDGRWVAADDAHWWDAGYRPLGFSEATDVAYMIGPDEQGLDVLRKVNVLTGEVLDTVFAADGYDAGSLLLDPVSRQPAGVVYVEHTPKIHYFDDALAALQRALDTALPDTFNQIVSMTDDRRRLLIRSSSDVNPGTISYLDRDQGSLSQISVLMPGISPESMSPVEPVNYEARDGMTIHAYLTVPKGAAREGLPVIVMPHGGPASRDDKTFWYLSQFVASRGYAVFQPNFRGSTGYGRSFEYAGRKQWGGKMQEDITDGAKWLVEHGIADANRMCIVGWSYGGYAAAIGAVQTPDLYQCAASINGVLNLPGLIADDQRYIGGSTWTRHMGLEGDRASSVSPYHQAESIQIPMLIVQAKDDPRVHEDQGKGMANRLRRLKKPVTYVEVDFGGHSMQNEPARQMILNSLETFLKDNLGGI